MSNSNRNIVRFTGFSWIVLDFKSGYDIFSKPWAACNGFDMLITVDMSEFLYSCGAPQFEPWLLDDRDARWGRFAPVF